MLHKYFEINKNGHNIRCKSYFIDKNLAEKVVIFCTGFAGHKDNNAAEKFADKLLGKNKNAAVIVFDWPAHGDDVKKKLSLDDCTAYLDLVIDEAGSMFGTDQLYAYATSFGGYLILKYLHEIDDPFVKIALRSPAVNMYGTLINSIMRSGDTEILNKGKDASVGFDRKVVITRSFLDDLKFYDVREWDYLDFAEDMLILHGTKDEIVPFDQSKEFAENNVIEFIPVQNADHRFQDPVLMSLATKHVLEFFGMR